MTIRKQVDNLIDWYAKNGARSGDIICDCSTSTLNKFAPKQRELVNRIEPKGKSKTITRWSARKYRGYIILRKRKDNEGLYKLQTEMFGAAVRE